ncbi:MAG: hypothetical protein Q8Q01_00990 [archaeon]|nr:hypothetical protein [archaeon]
MKLTQKLIGLIVLALFCLSILPVAFADNDRGETRIRGNMLLDGAEVDSETRVETSGNGIRVEERIRERLREGSEDEENEENETEVDDDDSESLKRNFEMLRERLKQAQEKIKENKESLKKIKERVSSCREDGECSDVKKELRHGVANHLEKSLDVLLNLIAKVRNRVEVSALSEEEKSDALTKLSEAEEKANLLLENISAANYETADEVKESIKEVKEIWKEAQETQRSLVAQLMSKKTADLIEKHQILSARMQARIDTLSSEGFDVSAMEEIHAKFDEHILKIEEDYKKAEDLREGNDKQAWRKAMQVVKEDLGVSRDLLREFTRVQQQFESSVDDSNDQVGDSENNSDDSGNTDSSGNQTEIVSGDEVTE